MSAEHTEARRENFIFHITHSLSLHGLNLRRHVTTEMQRLLLGKPDQYFMCPELNKIYLVCLQEIDTATDNLPPIRISYLGGPTVTVKGWSGYRVCCELEELKKEIIEYDQRRSHADAGG